MTLSPSDITFFADQNNWRYGPMYDLWVYFAADADPSFVESCVLEAGDLIAWNQVAKPRMLKTILEIEGLPPVGLVHCYHASKPRRPFACYSVAIYPPHYERALGGPIETGNVSDERWHELDVQRVRLFHEALFQLVSRIKQSIPLIAVAINSEDRGFASPYVEDGSICVSPNVAEILGYANKPLPDSAGFFVSIGHPGR